MRKKWQRSKLNLLYWSRATRHFFRQKAERRRRKTVKQYLVNKIDIEREKERGKEWESRS